MSKYSENLPPKLQDAIGWMFDYIKPNKTFLDFGCSTGYFGQLIKETKNNKVYGVEISDDINEAGKVLDGVYSFDIDGEWPNEVYERKYDYVFFGDVLEHLKYPDKALEKCHKLLKDNGLIFISTPNIAHISTRLELLGGNFDYEPMGILDNTHLKYFTRKSLTGLIESAGYRVKVMNFTANDYPDKVIKEMLSKNGLAPNQRFWKMVNTLEARAFQYKLIIESAARPNTSRAKIIKQQKPESIRNAAYDDLKAQVKNLRHHAKEQANIIEHYINANKEQANKLQQLEEENKQLKHGIWTRVRHRLKNRNN